MWAVQTGLVVTTEIELTAPSYQEIIEQKSQGWLRRFWWIIVGVIVIILALIGVWVSQLAVSSDGVQSTQLAEPQRWQELASPSSARSSFAFVAYENQLYAIGGQTKTSVTNVVERYDPLLDSWSSLSPKKIPVADVSSVVIGGKIIVPGGRMESGDVTDIVEVYDPYEDNWTMVSPIPKGLSSYAVATYEGKMYLFGGWDGKQFTDSVYMYDPAQDFWSLDATLPAARGFSGTAVVSNRIYILGGYDSTSALNTNDIFLPGNSEKPWMQGTSMPEGRFGVGVASFADVIYVIGGTDENGNVLRSLQYNVNEGIWKPFGSLQSKTWKNMGVLPFGSKLYILGGELGDQLSDKLWGYQAMYLIVLPIIQQ